MIRVWFSLLYVLEGAFDQVLWAVFQSFGGRWSQEQLGRDKVGVTVTAVVEYKSLEYELACLRECIVKTTKFTDEANCVQYGIAIYVAIRS